MRDRGVARRQDGFIVKYLLTISAATVAETGEFVYHVSQTAIELENAVHLSNH